MMIFTKCDKTHIFSFFEKKSPEKYQEVPFSHIVINTVNDESGFLRRIMRLFQRNLSLLKFCRNIGLQGAGEAPFLLGGPTGGSAPIPGVQKYSHKGKKKPKKPHSLGTKPPRLFFELLPPSSPCWFFPQLHILSFSGLGSP